MILIGDPGQIHAIFNFCLRFPPPLDTTDINVVKLIYSSDMSMRVKKKGLKSTMNHKNNQKKGIPSIYIHLGFAVIAIGIILILVFKFSNFINGNVLTPDDLAWDDEELPDTESQDYILPLITAAENIHEDDGETVIVCFGNAPFADDRGADNNVCNLIAQKTGATVYNCSIPGSHMTAYNETFLADSVPMDAFSFYWLTTMFCLDNFQIADNAFKYIPDVSPDITESFELLKSIDFDKVDVITLMYDGSDYLDNLAIVNTNFTDPQTFCGSMAAGIELIQETYPHIRIIVMSPTYAFNVAEDGSYVSSDIVENDWGFLATYSSWQAQTAYQQTVSFVDHFYGTIHEDIAGEYLEDNIHLNNKGREAVAERFVYALNLYPNPVAG